MARDASLSGQSFAMRRVGVASPAAGAISRRGLLDLLVRVVAGEARHAALAAAKTGARGQAQSFIARVAGIVEVGQFGSRSGIGAVAPAAEAIHAGGAELHRSTEAVVSGIVDVRGAWAVADLAAHAGFVRGDFPAPSPTVNVPVEWQEKQLKIRTAGSKVRNTTPLLAHAGRE